MRVRSGIKVVVLAALLAIGLQPAHAGPIAGRAGIARIAYAEVKLGTNATGYAILEEIQGSDFETQASIIPTAEGSYNSYIASPAADTTGYPRYLGCIAIVSSAGSDGNCTDFSAGKDPKNPKYLMPSCTEFTSPRPGCVRAPATLTIDPAFRDGRVTFSVGSNIAGYAITAIFGLTPLGNPEPLQAGAGTSLTPIPPSSPGPASLASDHAFGLFQNAQVTLGTIRSDILPGAPAAITGTKRAGMLVSLTELTAGDLLHLMCTGATTPPDTPDTVGGGVLPEIKTGLPHIWQPNHCYA